MLKNKLKHYIAFRLVIFIVIFGFLTTVSISAIQLYFDYRKEIGSIEKRMEEIRQSYLPNITYDMWVMDRTGIQLDLNGIIRIPTVKHAKIQSQDRIIAEAGLPQTEKIILREFPLRYGYDNKETFLGTLFVTASVKEVHQNLTHRVLDTLLAEGAKTFLISLFILFIFQLLVTRHLQTIADYFRNINFKKLDKPLILEGRAGETSNADELDRVVTAINTMSMELKGAFNELSIELEKRKQSEEAIERISHQNELILESTGEGILGLDLEGNHTFVNPAAATMLGYPVEDLLGKHSHPIWHHTKADGSPYPEEECPVYKTFRDGAVHRVDDEVFWRKDNAGFTASYTSTPIIDNNKIIGAVLNFTDITERKSAEEALKKNEEKFRQLIERIPVAIAVADKKGNFIFFNNRFV